MSIEFETDQMIDVMLGFCFTNNISPGGPSSRPNEFGASASGYMRDYYYYCSPQQSSPLFFVLHSNPNQNDMDFLHMHFFVPN
jgi:hypothetical protein